MSDSTRVLPESEIHKNQGRFVDLKRTAEECLINNYHPVLLEVLKCNMDIQPVTGEMAIAFYIAKYISKAESALLRKEIQSSIDKVKKSNSLTANQKMRKIAMTLLRNREVSSQESAFRMCPQKIDQGYGISPHVQESRQAQNGAKGHAERCGAQILS